MSLSSFKLRRFAFIDSVYVVSVSRRFFYFFYLFEHAIIVSLFLYSIGLLSKLLFSIGPSLSLSLELCFEN